MTCQTVPSNSLCLRYQEGELEHHKTFQVNRKRCRDLGRMVITTLETERSMTLFCTSLTTTGLNLLPVLRSGFFELVESGKDNAGVIKLPPVTPPGIGQRDIPPKPSLQYRQASVGVFTDATHAAWKEVLQPGHTYGLRLSESNGEAFACYMDEIDDRPENLLPAQKLPVGREDGTYYFTVQDDPAPPRIFARLEMPSKAHLHSPIPFILVIEYTTDSLEPLVFDKSRSSLSVTRLCSGDLNCVDELIDCRDNESGEEVEWNAVFACWDGDPHPKFPDDDDFVEISADRPWRFECTLENLDDEKESIRSMKGLETGRTYKARVDGPGGFSRWQYGKKEELLTGSQEDKVKRWEVNMEKLGYFDVERSEEDVYFETVP